MLADSAYILFASTTDERPAAFRYAYEATGEAIGVCAGFIAIVLCACHRARMALYRKEF
jgi:hypothetical protein